MKTLNEWLTLYARDHQNPLNQKIHKVCVPAIMWSVLALLWVLPTPSIFHSVPILNWCTLFVFGCLLFYFSIGKKVLLLMIPVTFVLVGITIAVEQTGLLWQIALAVFVVAWIGQFYGHKIEGQKPSFFEDVQFLLIGPLWVFKGLIAPKE